LKTKISRYFSSEKLTCLFLGTLFLVAEPVQNSNFFSPDKNKTHVRYNIPADSLSSDGPIIVYENGGITYYSVFPSGSNFEISRKNMAKHDTLSCFIDETKRRFCFQLKDTIITENDTYDLPGKMLVLSDIHANFKGLEMILTGAGVLDDNLNWIFGKGHLVFDGDIFDRGDNATECLWLIYKLENEAVQHGGKVHLILGNHEILNLKGNYNNVRNKYFKNSDALNLEYKKWYAPDTELGKWLRSKNCIEKIGEYLFVHGGISSAFPKNKYTITEINDNIRQRIDSIYNEGEMSKDIFIGWGSPLWYRGLVESKESLEEVEQTLVAFGSSKMILGHTEVDEINYLYNGKIIPVDLRHRINTEKGQMFALWFENNNFFIIDNLGSKTNLR
jgi:hypothetical protein